MSAPKVAAGTLQLPLQSAEAWRKRLAEPPEGLFLLVACAAVQVRGGVGAAGAGERVSELPQQRLQGAGQDGGGGEEDGPEPRVRPGDRRGAHVAYPIPFVGLGALGETTRLFSDPPFISSAQQRLHLMVKVEVEKRVKNIPAPCALSAWLSSPCPERAATAYNLARARTPCCPCSTASS